MTAYRCERCNVIQNTHPDSAKLGGLPLLKTADGLLCVVCDDWLNREAKPQWEPPNPLRTESEATEGTQTTLV